MGRAYWRIKRSPLPGPIHDRWALLVGVNSYMDPAFSSLKYCVNDVLALETQLRGLGYTVVTLHDDASEKWLLPTRENVEAELIRLCKAVGLDDLLLVHVACHGKLVDGQAVLIMQDSRAPTLAKKALRVTEVENQMRESKARRLVFLLDACHTGVDIGRDLADPEFIKNVHDLAQGYALIAASSSQQVAQEWAEKKAWRFYLLSAGWAQWQSRQGKQAFRHRGRHQEVRLGWPASLECPTRRAHPGADGTHGRTGGHHPGRLPEVNSVPSGEGWDQ